MERSQVVLFRVSTRERQALEAIAESEHQKLSEVLRAFLREGALKRGLWNIQPGTQDTQAHEQKA